MRSVASTANLLVAYSFCFTGDTHDYGSAHAPNLRTEYDVPGDCTSVRGTESDLKVPPVQLAAMKGDRMAQVLLRNGSEYGEQFVVFQSKFAYPAYVITYTMSPSSPV